MSALLVAGSVIGPLVFAAVSGIFSSASEQERLGQAYRLLQAYDERYPQLLMVSLDLAGDAIDCGYEPERLFGSAYMAASEEWTTFAGYFDLFLWRDGEFQERVQQLRADYLRQELSPFESTFLDQCIRRTAAASLCASYLRGTLERGELQSSSSLPGGSPPVDQSRENRTICIYLDGVAARNGLPLSRRHDPISPSPAARTP